MKHYAIHNERHPGITMHKISVGANFAGVLFTVGILAIGLVAVPEARYFVVFAAALGIGVGGVLRWMHR